MPREEPTKNEASDSSGHGRTEASGERLDGVENAGRPPLNPDHPADLTDDDRQEMLFHLLEMELELRRNRGEDSDSDDDSSQFPASASTLGAPMGPLEEPEARPVTTGDESTIPFAADPWDAAPEGSVRAAMPDLDPPEHWWDMFGLSGRYRPIRVLGYGGFGRVFLAFDRELEREVAIKVTGARVTRSGAAYNHFAHEARLAAGLRHPGIVTVFDVGTCGGGFAYIVLEYIKGVTLASLLGDKRLSLAMSVELLAQVADAVHHVHTRKRIHRDLKPSNIVVDMEGRPYVIDFGLAIRRGARAPFPGEIVGTPRYMAPEQVRGETHRLDGRTDVWALGVILHLMIADRAPFSGERPALFDAILNIEPKALRAEDPAVSAELERICLKCLSKRMSDRYETAADLASDLRHWLERERAAAPASVRPHARIVPKGLRSFDRIDSDFFIELLPGPKDRDGLPKSLRFWKSFAEETAPTCLDGVGILFGPSGCGKSSLIKAGLLPRLASHVIPIYIEAAPGETETRLLRALRRYVPAIPADAGLPEAVAALHQEGVLAEGVKVLFVIDQFEQWLHTRRGSPEEDLARAVRQCDGGRVQCILAVRDDFWMAITRFLREVEVEHVQGRNSAEVDLFEPAHARQVLARFGQAFGRFPDHSETLTGEQDRFLEQAVATLMRRDGQVTPVRLNVFVELVKNKPWVPSTIGAFGGIEGIGVKFLEEAFDDPDDPTAGRPLLQPARSVLKSLLPEPGADIRGPVRSDAELLSASGLQDRAADFADLMRRLEMELRLVSPIDPASSEPMESSNGAPRSGPRFYQLTHDFLVPSIRSWLLQEQKRTFRGRAKIRLAERQALWAARKNGRDLPSIWEYASFLLLTNPREWTPAQKEMMAAATRRHAVRVAFAALVFVGVSMGAVEIHGRVRAGFLRDRLVEASTEDVPEIVRAMAPYRRWTEPLLVAEENAERARTTPDRRKCLHINMAMLRADPRRLDELTTCLLEAEPREFLVVREWLLDHADRLTGRLWARALDPAEETSKRFRAACALADFDPDDPRWRLVAADVGSRLSVENPSVVAQWIEALRPVRAKLIPSLREIFEDETRPEPGYVAASVLADFLGDDPKALVALTLDAEHSQLSTVLPALSHQTGKTEPLLMAAVKDRSAAARTEDERDALAKTRANAALALMSVGRADAVWPLLKSGPDPRLRSYLIHLFSPAGIDARVLTSRFVEEPEPSARQAILLGLCDYETHKISPGERSQLLPWLLGLYRDDPDPGVHSAAERLLRLWGRSADLQETDRALAATGPRNGRRWYVNGEGFSFAVVRAGVVTIGGDTSNPRGVRIRHDFAIATKEVTVAQYQRFLKATGGAPVDASSPDLPISGVTLYEAASYCRWLSGVEDVAPDQMCYPPLAEICSGMRLPADHLSRTGYRLPTEAEWVRANQSDATTTRFYGNEERMLPRYGWTVLNANGRPWPVGTLAPNDLGLFDGIGNVYEWCVSPVARAPTPPNSMLDDNVGDPVISDATERVQRGGSFDSRISNLSTNYSNPNVPHRRSGSIGFRVARTCK